MILALCFLGLAVIVGVSGYVGYKMGYAQRKYENILGVVDED
jgi:hypothetical protein